MVDEVAATLWESLKHHVGETARPSAESIAATLSGVADRDVRAISVDGDTIHVAMPVTPYELAQMAALRYSDGASHEDVTAWLEESTAGRFREVLWEIECKTAESSLFKRWMLAPKTITMTLSLGPEAPHGA